MDVRVESITGLDLVEDMLLIGVRSPEQVTERLDRLILQIKEVQKPFMRGEEPADVLVVCKLSFANAPSASSRSLTYARSHMV